MCKNWRSKLANEISVACSFFPATLIGNDFNSSSLFAFLSDISVLLHIERLLSFIVTSFNLIYASLHHFTYILYLFLKFYT